MVEIKLIKIHPDAILPTQAHEGDNCWDIYACGDTLIPGSEAMGGGFVTPVKIGKAVVPVGLKIAYITPGYGLVFRGRSGLAFKHDLRIHPGELDNFYRGDMGVKLYNFSASSYQVKKGDRIAQIKIEKNYDASFEFTDTVDETTRGEGGFGSTGR